MQKFEDCEEPAPWTRAGWRIPVTWVSLFHEHMNPTSPWDEKLGLPFWEPSVGQGVADGPHAWFRLHFLRCGGREANWKMALKKSVTFFLGC